MRPTPILLSVAAALLATTSVALAEAHHGITDGAATAATDLGPTEVRTYLKGADAEIAQCYVGAVGARAGSGAGRLEVTLTIHRKGIVDRIDVAAPGLSAKLVKRIDTCVRAALDGVTFPTRRLGTTAVVPYYWQKTAAPDAGPQASCWEAKGCKTTDDPPGAATSANATATSNTNTTDTTRTKPVSTTTGRQARRAHRAS